MSTVRDTLHKDSRSAIRKPGATLTRRTPQILALTILLSVTICGPITHAQEMFKLLGAKEIRARVVGNDITDSAHWVIYFRTDGVLIGDEQGQKWTGSWKIQKNKLCMSNPNLESPDCKEVWMSGANIRMRANQDQETFDAVVEQHRVK
jgi:hypothetical protein